MANLKDISTVPELKSLEGTEKVLLNVDGSARQVQVDLIKPKTTRELVYEWNFSAEDDVIDLVENISEDISWLTTLTEDVDWEIFIECYGYNYDEENDEYSVNEDITFSAVLSKYNPSVGCFKNVYNVDSGLMAFSEPMGVNIDGNHQGVCVGISASSGADLEGTPVDNGGTIGIFVENDNPFKSVKIYKITK